MHRWISIVVVFSASVNVSAAFLSSQRTDAAPLIRISSACPVKDNHFDDNDNDTISKTDGYLRDDLRIFSGDPVMSRRSSLFFGVAGAALMNPMIAQPTSAMDLERPEDNDSISRLKSQAKEVTTLSVAATEPTSLQESISGFVAGGALAATKTLVKYPLDTVTVRLQVPSSEYSFRDINRLFSGSYNGITLSLLSNIPGGAIFFAVKDATKAGLKQSALTAGAPKWFTTTLAVGAALIPYWIIRNPSEVIKVRQQAGIPGYGEGVSAIDALKMTFNETNAKQNGKNQKSISDGVESLYTGYWENVLYGLPADIVKFVVYESLTDGRKNLSPVEGAKAGAFATATAQLVTTPLDVVRNRLMTGSEEQNMMEKNSYAETLVKLGKEEGLSGLFAGASPRVAKAFLSGAIQFATYEETKQSISRVLQRR